MKPQKIQLRRGTTAEWDALDPVLAAAEIGVDLDTGFLKIGDGTSLWSELPYYAPLTVGPTAPPTPALNALWVDTS